MMAKVDKYTPKFHFFAKKEEKFNFQNKTKLSRSPARSAVRHLIKYSGH